MIYKKRRPYRLKTNRIGRAGFTGKIPERLKPA
jgi:hypothetical protein